MKEIKKLFRELMVKLLRKYVFIPHAFPPTSIIKSINGDVLLEVDDLYYDKELLPVLVVKKYGQHSGSYSISYPTVLDFVEYKGVAPNGGMEI